MLLGVPPQSCCTGEGHLDRHLRRCRAVYRERHRLMWKVLGQLLPAGYRRLPAEVGLHLTVHPSAVGSDERLWRVIEKRDLLVGSLARTYQFTDPASGFLLGFGAVPTQLVTTAVGTFCSAIQQAGWRAPASFGEAGLTLDSS